MAIALPRITRTAILILVAVCSQSGGQESEQPRPILPDPKLTPGDAFDVTKEDICVRGNARKVRNVTPALKRQVYARYGITRWKTGDYEVDHLIPLSLGGSNSIKSLWPQSTRTSPWNSDAKVALDRRLHNLVCAGKLDLRTAQQAVASNWIEAYKKYVGHEPKTFNPPESSSPDHEVWVNLRSGKYWRPGSRCYGKTSRGEFMTEIDALDRGYSPAGGTGQ